MRELKKILLCKERDFLKYGGAVGINQVTSSNEVSIYPNPSNGSFIIETNVTEKQTAQVFDVNGRLLLSQNINSVTNNIDATTLNEGVYTLTIKIVDRVINKRLVILR